MTSKQSKLLIAVAAALTVGLIYFAPRDGDTGISEPAKAKALTGTARQIAVAPVSNPQGLERPARGNDEIGHIDNKLTRKMFVSTDWVVPPPPPPKPPPPPPPPAPTAPAMPYVFMGRFEQDNTNLVILARGNRVVNAAQGDILDKTYRIDRIDASKVTMTYLPLGTTQFISIGSTQ